MICPNCNESCEDGATFCPHCEAVLDASFLGDIPDQGDEADDTPVPDAPAPARPAARPQGKPARPRRRAPIDEPSDEPALAAPSPRGSGDEGGFKNKYSEYWVDDEPPVKKPDSAEIVSSRRAALAGNSAEFKPDAQDPADLLKEMWAGFRALHFEDKFTASAGLLLFLTSFMPWRTTPDGDDMGFLTWGFLTALLAAGSVAAIWVRKAGKFTALPPAKIPLLSLGAGVLSAVIGALFAITCFEHGLQYGKKIVVSQPASGVFLSILAAGAVIAGSILTAKRERQAR